MLKQFAETIPELKKLKLDVFIEKTSAVNAEPYSAGTYVMFSIITLLVVFMILGIVVQYTKIGDLPSIFFAGRADKVEDRKNKIALFFYSFNPIVNLQKLFTVKESVDKRLDVLNGVRVLSIGWVVLGHGFSFAAFGGVLNQTTLSQLMIDDKLFGLVPGGFYAVDSFFWLSGFLTFYLLTAKMYPKKGKTNFGLVYFHRYYRLIFPLIFITGMSMYIFPIMGDGPFYRSNWTLLTKNCQKWWWTNILFINNLVPWDMNSECIGWVWYLANDFQFFLLSPPIIYLYCKKRFTGYLASLLIIIGSMLTNGIVTAIYDVTVTLTANDINPMNILYSKPWGRAGAYFVGAIMGFMYFELACKEKYPELNQTLGNGIFNKLKNSQITSLIFAAIGIGLTALYVFPLRSFYLACGASIQGGDNCWSPFTSFIYNLTSRPFFVFGFGLVLMPTFVERLRIVKNFLRSEIFIVLARLNYMVYMVHCLVIFWYLNDTRQAGYMTSLNQWMFSIGVTVVSFLFAVPLTLFCEVPFMNIEKYILFPTNRRKTECDPKASVKSNGSKVNYYPLSDDKENDETVDTKKKLLDNSL